MSAVSTRLRRIGAELNEVSEQIERLASLDYDGGPLVGAQEIQEMSGTARSTLHFWKQQGKMPAPIAELACGAIWLRADIEEWLQSL